MHNVIKELVFIDQISKLICIVLLKGTIPVIHGFLEFSLVRNSGISLGFLSNLAEPYSMALKAVIGCIILAMFIYFKLRGNSLSFLRQVALELIIAGALSNFLDRLIYNGVLDFISCSLFGNSLFICNIADIYITLGAIFLIISRSKKTENEAYKEVLFKEHGL